MGSAGGALKTGRYLRYAANLPHNHLLLSLIHAMGIPDASFGKKDWCSGPLERL